MLEMYKDRIVRTVKPGLHTQMCLGGGSICMRVRLQCKLSVISVFLCLFHLVKRNDKLRAPAQSAKEWGKSVRRIHPLIVQIKEEPTDSLCFTVLHSRKY